MKEKPLKSLRLYNKKFKDKNMSKSQFDILNRSQREKETKIFSS